MPRVDVGIQQLALSQKPSKQWLVTAPYLSNSRGRKLAALDAFVTIICALGVSGYPLRTVVGAGARPRRIAVDYPDTAQSMTIGLSSVVNGPEHLGH